MGGAFRQEDVIRPSIDPKVGETLDALSLRFNCKKGNLVYDINAKIAPKCAGLRFNCK